MNQTKRYLILASGIVMLATCLTYIAFSVFVPIIACLLAFGCAGGIVLIVASQNEKVFRNKNLLMMGYVFTIVASLGVGVPAILLYISFGCDEIPQTVAVAPVPAEEKAAEQCECCEECTCAEECNCTEEEKCCEGCTCAEEKEGCGECGEECTCENCECAEGEECTCEECECAEQQAEETAENCECENCECAEGEECTCEECAEGEECTCADECECENCECEGCECDDDYVVARTPEDIEKLMAILRDMKEKEEITLEEYRQIMFELIGC